MKVIKAKILDETHLELSQPILLQPGHYIQISIPETSDLNEEDSLWKEKALQKLLEAYSDEDSIYDNL